MIRMTSLASVRSGRRVARVPLGALALYRTCLLGTCIVFIAACGGTKTEYQVRRLRTGKSPNIDPVEAFHAEMIEDSDELWALASSSQTPGVSNVREPSDLDVSLGCLEQVLYGTDYSTRLAEAWLKWRYRTQLYSHGASNQSVIPNDFYNERRQAMIRIIQFYLRDHPGDGTAAHQLATLTSAPDIKPLSVGNTALGAWAKEADHAKEKHERGN